MTFVGNLGYVAVAIVGSILAVAGTITVGVIQHSPICKELYAADPADGKCF